MQRGHIAEPLRGLSILIVNASTQPFGTTRLDGYPPLKTP